jgi:tetratricopeptide (TPR) repeat protein
MIVLVFAVPVMQTHNHMSESEPKRPLKVFLCHARSDQSGVHKLYTRLVKDGVDVWLDKEKLLPGQDWESEIRKAVREADVVVVCLSKQFNQAGFRQKEVRLALDTAMEKPEGEIFIIPARLEECDTLESLRKLHWVDLFEDDGYKKLKQSLGLRAEQVGAIFHDKPVSMPMFRLAEKRNIRMDTGTLNSLGIMYVEKGNYLKAIECFEQSLLLSREMGDRMSEASILNNLGSTYGKVGDLVRAVELYEQALLMNREIGI